MVRFNFLSPTIKRWLLLTLGKRAEDPAASTIAADYPVFRIDPAE
jgi:hypothetical protein